MESTMLWIECFHFEATDIKICYLIYECFTPVSLTTHLSIKQNNQSNTSEAKFVIK
jgi:hypothetical protein